MKINNPTTTPVAKPVEATAPAKAAEPVRSEVAPESAPAQLSPEEAAEQSKARDNAARAQFAQHTESLDGKLAGVEGVEVAQLTPQQFVKQAKAFVDQIAANPDNAAAKAKEVGEALDKLSKAIGGMDADQRLAALSNLNDLGIAVHKAKIEVSNRLDFGGGSNDAGLKHIMQKLTGLERAIDN